MSFRPRKMPRVDWNQKLWERSLEQFGEFIEPLVAELGRSERREGAALYVQGLLTPGERKSIEPMAGRLGIDSQKLQQLVADSPWEEERVWRAIRPEVIPLMEPSSAWIIDETGWLKQGTKSVGVPSEVEFQTKPAIALGVIKQILADGVSPAPVLGDEVDGSASELRGGLRQLGLEYFLNVGGDLLAWTQPVKTRLAKRDWGSPRGSRKPFRWRP